MLALRSFNDVAAEKGEEVEGLGVLELYVNSHAIFGSVDDHFNHLNHALEGGFVLLGLLSNPNVRFVGIVASITQQLEVVHRIYDQIGVVRVEPRDALGIAA